jgi:CRP-like cAMP-binding protein
MLADSTRNAFIKALDQPARSRLETLAEPTNLQLGDVLFEPDVPFDACYFPLTAAVSLLTVMEDGVSIEAGLIGREGLAGFSALLGEDRMPWRGVVQMAGEALRVPVEPLLADNELVQALRPLAIQYQGALFWLATLTIACNRFHQIEQRTARWLLMINDRDDDDVIELTHEFLSEMLGVRRQSVTEALGALEERGLVRQDAHRRLRVLDRRGLEDVSCECYERIAPYFPGDGGPPRRP